MVNTATLWLEAGLEAGICWFVRVKCRLSQIHTMMARPELCVVLRQMQDGDESARHTLFNWVATAFGATNYLDAACLKEVQLQQ